MFNDISFVGDIMTVKEILHIINELNRSSGLERPTYYYSNGGCYIFAKYLQHNIGGNIRYLTKEYHCVLEKNNKLYDTTGNVTKLYKNSEFITEEEFLNRPKLHKTIRLD